MCHIEEHLKIFWGYQKAAQAALLELRMMLNKLEHCNKELPAMWINIHLVAPWLHNTHGRKVKPENFLEKVTIKSRF